MILIHGHRKKSRVIFKKNDRFFGTCKSCPGNFMQKIEYSGGFPEHSKVCRKFRHDGRTETGCLRTGDAESDAPHPRKKYKPSYFHHPAKCRIRLPESPSSPTRIFISLSGAAFRILNGSNDCHRRRSRAAGFSGCWKHPSHRYQD